MPNGCGSGHATYWNILLALPRFGGQPDLGLGWLAHALEEAKHITVQMEQSGERHARLEQSTWLAERAPASVAATGTSAAPRGRRGRQP